MDASGQLLVGLLLAEGSPPMELLLITGLEFISVCPGNALTLLQEEMSLC